MSTSDFIYETKVDTLMALQLWLKIDVAVGLIQAAEDVENYEQCEGIQQAIELYIGSDREFNCTIGESYYEE